MPKRSSAFNPLPLARRNAMYKGLLGGERSWLIIGAIVWIPRLLKRALGRNEEVVLTEKLLPGQAIRIEALPQRTKQQRQRYRRTG